MTTTNLHAANLPANTLHEQTTIRDIRFTKNEKYAVILPVGVVLHNKTHTMHRSERATSRWALRLATKNIAATIIDKAGLVYNANRDTETGEYTLLPTNNTLENITIC